MRTDVEQKAPLMFSVARNIGIKVPGGERVVMRSPTEDEWKACMRRHVLSVGADGEVDASRNAMAQLASELIVDGVLPDDWRDWAQARVLRFKGECSAQPDGTVRVTARVAGGAEVSFRFRMPSATAAEGYLAKSLKRVSGVNGRDGMVIDVAWIGERYDELVAGEPTGYAEGEGAPLWHKVDAMDSAFGFVRRLMEADDADFFVEEDGPSAQLAPGPSAESSSSAAT